MCFLVLFMGKIEGYRIFAFCVFVFMGVLIFYMSTVTFPAAPPSSFVVHWRSMTYHVIAFFIFASFLLVALAGDKNWKIFLVGILVSFMYGVLDELHQIYVPGRGATIFDAFMDFIGVLLAGVVYLGFRRRGR